MSRAAAGILVVIDGSATSLRALEVAIDRALERSASLTLLGIIPPRLWRAKRSAFQIPQDQRDEEFVHGVLERASMRCQERGAPSTTRTRSGPPAEIIRAESTRGFDLIVLGERPNLVGAPSLASIVKDRIAIPLEIVHEGGEDPG